MFNLIGIDQAHAEFIVKQLADLRGEMEQAMPGGHLRTLQTLMIFDVCNVLGLTPEERVKVLGDHNERSVKNMINSTVSLRAGGR